MNIQTIAEHSVDLDLLSGGICIDAGCRGFQFSLAMRDLGLHVAAFDLEDMESPEGIRFFKKALSNESGVGNYKDTKDAQAKHLIASDGIPCGIWGLNEFYKCLLLDDNEYVDILKLDIEGSEYYILSDPNFQPIPKQISIEFHMHAHRKLHDQYYEACMSNLLKHYEPAQHELTQAHGCGLNYWDSLFVRRDLIQPAPLEEGKTKLNTKEYKQQFINMGPAPKPIKPI
jgi:hypothetical protein